MSGTSVVYVYPARARAAAWAGPLITAMAWPPLGASSRFSPSPSSAATSSPLLIGIDTSDWVGATCLVPAGATGTATGVMRSGSAELRPLSRHVCTRSVCPFRTSACTTSLDPGASEASSLRPLAASKSARSQSFRSSPARRMLTEPSSVAVQRVTLTPERRSRRPPAQLVEAALPIETVLEVAGSGVTDAAWPTPVSSSAKVTQTAVNAPSARGRESFAPSRTAATLQKTSSETRRSPRRPQTLARLPFPPTGYSAAAGISVMRRRARTRTSRPRRQQPNGLEAASCAQRTDSCRALRERGDGHRRIRDERDGRYGGARQRRAHRHAEAPCQRQPEQQLVRLQPGHARAGQQDVQLDPGRLDRPDRHAAHGG